MRKKMSFFMYYHIDKKYPSATTSTPVRCRGGGSFFYVPLKGHIFWPCKGWGRPCRAATLSRLDGMNSKLA